MLNGDANNQVERKTDAAGVVSVSGRRWGQRTSGGVGPDGSPGPRQVQYMDTWGGESTWKFSSIVSVL